jgi:hypothetical protein
MRGGSVIAVSRSENIDFKIDNRFRSRFLESKVPCLASNQ